MKDKIRVLDLKRLLNKSIKDSEKGSKERLVLENFLDSIIDFANNEYVELSLVFQMIASDTKE